MHNYNARSARIHNVRLARPHAGAGLLLTRQSSRPVSDSMVPPQTVHLAPDGDVPADGSRRLFNQVERVYYSGYWIKTYPVPADTLRAKKELIDALTRRLFNHTEHGLNVPGVRLNEARAAYNAETDPATRRVKGAMLAGA